MAIIIVGKSPDWQYRWVLRRGQHARVGRSPWAEFCIDGDNQLHDFHCHLALDQFANTTITAVDDAPISIVSDWTTMAEGEELRMIVGQTQLTLRREPRLANQLFQRGTQEFASPPISAHDQHQPAEELLRDIGLSDTALERVAEQATPLQSVQALLDHDMQEDAVRFLAASLPPTQRLAWCHQVLQQAGYALTGPTSGWLPQWLAEPTEALRQALASHVDWNHKLDPRTWLLASVGWTGGNLSGADSIHVPPTDRMVITGVITALGLASAKSDAAWFQKEAIEKGIQMMGEATK